MSRIFLSIAVCLAAIVARAASFYNSAEFYALLSAKGTESSLVDAVFTYETDNKDKLASLVCLGYNEKAASLACLGYEPEKKYSEADKINLVHRSRALRYAYMQDIARARKEHAKPQKWKDNIRFHRTKGRFIPPHFEEWIRTSQGTKSLESVKSVTMDFDGFLSYLVKGRDALHPRDVLHRNIGNIETKNKGEQIDWLYRAQVCLIKLAAENARRPSPGKTNPIAKQETGKPIIKPFRVRE